MSLHPSAATQSPVPCWRPPPAQEHTIPPALPATTHGDLASLDRAWPARQRKSRTWRPARDYADRAPRPVAARHLAPRGPGYSQTAGPRPTLRIFPRCRDPTSSPPRGPVFVLAHTTLAPEPRLLLPAAQPVAGCGGHPAAIGARAGGALGEVGACRDDVAGVCRRKRSSSSLKSPPEQQNNGHMPRRHRCRLQEVSGIQHLSCERRDRRLQEARRPARHQARQVSGAGQGESPETLTSR